MTAIEKITRVLGEPNLVIPKEEGISMVWHFEEETVIVLVQKKRSFISLKGGKKLNTMRQCKPLIQRRL